MLLRKHNNDIDNIIVIMTACVSPVKHKKLIRDDPAIRMQDYLYALSFWLTLNDERIKGIVFLENSGYDGLSFRDLVKACNPYNRTFEYINVEQSIIPDGIHYGWAEFKMLDEGIEKSLLCKNAKFLIKATGRYTKYY